MAVVPHSTVMPNFHTYGASPDGSRFIVPMPLATLDDGGPTAAIAVVLDWPALLGE